MTDTQRIEQLEQQMKMVLNSLMQLSATVTAHNVALNAINGSIKLLGHLEEDQ